MIDTGAVSDVVAAVARNKRYPYFILGNVGVVYTRDRREAVAISLVPAETIEALTHRIEAALEKLKAA